MSYRSIFNKDVFKDQTIIVTGGAAASVVARPELASLACPRGADRTQAGQTPIQVVAEIVEDGGQASAYGCDIREEDRVKETVKSHCRGPGASTDWSITQAANTPPHCPPSIRKALKPSCAPIVGGFW